MPEGDCREMRAQCKGQRRAPSQSLGCAKPNLGPGILAARIAKASRKPDGDCWEKWRARCKGQRRARSQGRRRCMVEQAARPLAVQGRRFTGRRHTGDGTPEGGCRERRAQCKGQHRTRRQWRRRCEKPSPGVGSQAARNSKASGEPAGDYRGGGAQRKSQQRTQGKESQRCKTTPRPRQLGRAQCKGQRPARRLQPGKARAMLRPAADPAPVALALRIHATGQV